MSFPKIGGFALMSFALSSPAWAGGADDGCKADIAAGVGFGDVALGEMYSEKAVGQIRTGCSAEGLSVDVIVTSEAGRLDEPFQNPASETDVSVSAQVGPLSFEVGKSFYTATNTEDTFLRGNLVLPLGFTLSTQRYEGITNATMVGLQSPSIDVSGVSVSAGAWYAKFDDPHTDPLHPNLTYSSRSTYFVQADVPVSDRVAFEFQAFQTSNGTTGITAALVFRLG